MSAQKKVEAITYFCRCDQCRKSLYTGDDWFHKPGTLNDLCASHWGKLPEDERKDFVNVRAANDLGDQLDQYSLQATTFFARCDKCRKNMYVGDEWYHKPGGLEDLCVVHWQELQDSSRKEFVNIRTGAELGDQRDQYVRQEINEIITERDLVMVALDVEGTIMPEAWLALQEKTGIEELKRTTAHEPDYSKLMKYRFDALRKHGIKLQDMKDVVKDLKPLPGAMEFLEWLKPLVPRILLLTDTFEEYAMPMFEQLGYPTVFCNSIVVDEEGYMTDIRLRLKDQKRKAVESFQRLNFRVIAVGDSFNDISMLTAAERGILIYPSERVIKAHPEFPVARNHYDLRMKIGRILSANQQIMPRTLTPQPPIDNSSRNMWLVVINVAGTLAPEPWVAVQALTGIPELNTTSAQEPDFSKLMTLRAHALRKHGVKLQDVFNIMERLDVLPGAKDFLEWLKPIVPRVCIMTDGFEEYALPIFDKLGHPMVFCNFLETDAEGYMNKLVVRLNEQKLKTVQELQRLNFRIIAVGGSFNDLSMLGAADKGILYRPSDAVQKAHPEFPTVSNHEQLKTTILQIVNEGQEPKSKKAKTM
jgi:phosphoserine/homoserine phosphotransferase